MQTRASRANGAGGHRVVPCAGRPPPPRTIPTPPVSRPHGAETPFPIVSGPLAGTEGPDAGDGPASRQVGRWAKDARPGESARQRAYRACEGCGLASEGIDRLVEDVRLSGASRETAVRLWEETYDDPAKLEEARELCGGCVKAVVDATAQETP